jgi:hypothetical protein
MEFLSEFDCRIVYVKGEDNTVADALSRTDFEDSSQAERAAIAPFDEEEDGVGLVASVFDDSKDSAFYAARCLARTRVEAWTHQATLTNQTRIKQEPFVVPRGSKRYKK